MKYVLSFLAGVIAMFIFVLLNSPVLDVDAQPCTRDSVVPEYPGSSHITIRGEKKLQKNIFDEMEFQLDQTMTFQTTDTAETIFNFYRSHAQQKDYYMLEDDQKSGLQFEVPIRTQGSLICGYHMSAIVRSTVSQRLVTIVQKPFAAVRDSFEGNR
jgi:hypothetical protein